jgi:hypothetical protein
MVISTDRKIRGRDHQRSEIRDQRSEIRDDDESTAQTIYNHDNIVHKPEVRSLLGRGHQPVRHRSSPSLSR